MIEAIIINNNHEYLFKNKHTVNIDSKNMEKKKKIYLFIKHN